MDGHMDVVVGFEESGITRLYLNPTPAGDVTEPWPSVTVGVTPQVEDAYFADVDGDGRLDVISCSEAGSWGEPQGNIYVSYAPTTGSLLTPANWTTTPIPAAANVTEWMFGIAQQIDGLYGVDLIVAGKANDPAHIGAPASVLSVLQAPADPRNELAGWNRIDIGAVGWTMSVIGEDLDHDGDMDVVVSVRYEDNPGVRWYENPSVGGAGWDAPWTEHAIITNEHCSLMALVDFSGDGLPDILVQTGATPTETDSRLLFSEQVDAASDQWTTQEIEWPQQVGEAGKAVAVADINDDGSLDIVLALSTTEATMSNLIWLQRSQSGGVGAWFRHEISGPDGDKLDLINPIDLDGDGDLDVIETDEGKAAGTTGLGVLWYENPCR